MSRPTASPHPACPSCDARAEEADRFCIRCGEHLSGAQVPSDLPALPDQSSRCLVCGAGVLPGDRFCISCGKPVAASEPTVPVSVTSDDSLLQSHQPSSDPASPTTPGAFGHAAGGRNLALAAGAVLAVGLLMGAATTLLLMRDSAAPSAETPSQPVAEQQPNLADSHDAPRRAADSDQEADTTPDSPTSTERQRGDVGTLPTGLFCRDLYQWGYSYAEAVAYWEREGRTPRMDASGNGIPCQTVYPADEIDAYWNR